MTMLTNLRRPPYRTYSITQLCREFSATPRALRFYEEQGLLTPARRDLARVYSYKDRARLQLILRGRRVGLSIAEIRDILDLYEERVKPYRTPRRCAYSGKGSSNWKLSGKRSRTRYKR